MCYRTHSKYRMLEGQERRAISSVEIREAETEKDGEIQASEWWQKWGGGAQLILSSCYVPGTEKCFHSFNQSTIHSFIQPTFICTL